MTKSEIINSPPGIPSNCKYGYSLYPQLQLQQPFFLTLKMLSMKVHLSNSVFIAMLMRPLHLRAKVFACIAIAGFLSVSALAQINVTGRVTAGDSVLEGITVSVKNASIATKTNAQGQFTISVAPNATLVFTGIGFVSQEVKIENQTSLDIILVAQNQQLDDVVVVGYSTQRRGNITGAVASIKATDLMRTPSPTTSSALVGRVAGITARQATGRPGQGTSIQIRNLGAPLYVIDGVPQSEGQFNNISTEDIESISILKDGSAALYGFRASNGVVLVTTRKGRGGDKGKISVNTYYQLQNYTRYLSYSDAYTFTRASAEAQQNTNTVANGGGINGGTVTITAAELEKWRLGTDSGYQSTNYRDYILQKNAPQKYININASGGNDRMNYYISLGGLSQEGIVKQFDFKRYNFQTNVEGTIIKGVKFGTQLSGRIEGRYNPASTTNADAYDNPFLAILTMWPTERVYANNNSNYINGDVNTRIRNPAIYDRNVIGTQENIWNNFGSIFYATFELPFGFSAKATYSYNYKQNKNEVFRKSFDQYTYDKANDLYRVVQTQNLLRRNKSRQEIKENFAAFQLNYNKQFAGHTISATGAYEYATQTDEFVGITSLPATNYLPIIRTQDVTQIDNTYAITKRGSVIGRFNYDYRRRYLLELLGRYDGNSIYTQGKRWGLFPGITGGWVLSEENFYGGKLKGVMNYVKLRASWGRTGAVIGVVAFDFLMGGDFPSGSYVMADGSVTNGVGIRGLPITNITWAESTIKNIGIQLGFFNNKLTAEFDAFHRDLTGIPAQKTDVVVPVEVGYSLPNENLNSDRTEGIEGTITYANRAGQVSYSISGNATLARRRNIERYRPRFGNSWDQYRNQTDHRWADINWGYQVIGQFKSVEEIKDYPINNDGQGNTTQLPGDLKFKDANGDGVISSLDERPIGYGGNDGATFGGNNPYMSFGLSAGITWKGLSLNMDWAGATLQSYYRIFESVVPFQASHNSPEYLFNDRWHRADLYDNNSAWVPGKYPAIRRVNNHINYSRRSDFWINNISYARLRNLEVVYNLPKKIISKVHLSGVKVYVSGTNLITLFDTLREVELDPEIGQNNGLVYPIMKLYTFGINLTL
jgi:TonB-linked SusC/RagA family outer membrane protein